MTARDFIERPEQFGGILDSQVSSRARPECALSRKRISMLGEGKYCGNRIETPEFLINCIPSALQLATAKRLLYPSHDWGNLFQKS